MPPDRSPFAIDLVAASRPLSLEGGIAIAVVENRVMIERGNSRRRQQGTIFDTSQDFSRFESCEANNDSVNRAAASRHPHFAETTHECTAAVDREEPNQPPGPVPIAPLPSS